MNESVAEKDTFKDMLMAFAYEHKLNVEHHRSVKLLSFYTHAVEPLMLFKLDVDEVAPLVLKPFKNFKVDKLVNKLLGFLGEVAEDHLSGYLNDVFFDQFITHNIQKIVLKDGYKSVHDVAYYQVELLNNVQSTRILVNFHTEPTAPVFHRNPEMKGSIKYLMVDVYYRDFETLRMPMLGYYALEIGKFLNIPINEIDDNVLKLVAMVKI